MCYKKENHKKITLQLEEKLKDAPGFIAAFFVRYKSAVTKNCNWGYIRDLLQWLVDKGYIQKNSISEIAPNDLNGIVPENIAEYLGKLQDGSVAGRENSLSSINTKKNVFSAFWGYLVDREYVKKNIVKDDTLRLKFKSERKQKEVKIPTEDQLERFIRNLHDGNNNEFDIIRNLAIVKLIIGSGIRSEELINLEVKDVFLNGGKKINGHISEMPFINILGKGKIQEYDSVYISQEAKTYLQDYLKSRDIFVRENNVNDKALFLSNKKRRISKKVMENLFDRYSGKEINPHMLRHWVGTKLYEQTNDIVLVQKQLRHSSLETAAKYYVHMDEDKIAGAMAGL